MQKEVFLAIFIGFIVGLLITFGLWQANKAIKSTLPQNSIDSPVTPTAEVFKPTLNILSPAPEFLSKESKINLKGSYAPEAQIAVLMEKGEKIIQADSGGVFETEIELILGENQIEVSGFTKGGEEAKQVIMIVYSTAEI